MRLLCLVLVCFNASLLTASGELLNVGSAKQLFLDHRFIESSKGTELVVNRPRIPGEKLIIADKPWEACWIGGYLSVIQEGDRLHMWYEAADREEKRVGIAYAYSTDGGARWTKPNLGIIDFRGSKNNNLVSRDTGGTHVFRNRPDAPAAERYCMFVQTANKGPNQAFVSPDGLHWSAYGKVPFLDPKANEHLTLDSQNVIFWDTRLKKYVAYPRMNIPTNVGGARISRSFGYAASDTFGDFPKFKIVFKRDEMDSIDMDWYTTGAIQYPFAADTYLMFPAAYHHYPEPPVGKFSNDGPLDIQLATSRDGLQWDRLDRRPLIPLGLEGSWDSAGLYVGYGISRQGDELSLYYTAFEVTHGAYVATGVLGGIITRAIYRLDGFVSVDAPYGGGEFTTPAMVFSGDHLELNFEGSAGGWAHVEILDAQGKPLPNFTAKDADPVTGNSTGKTVKWGGQSDLSSLAGRPIKLRFVMRDAKLYAFQFVSGGSAGK